MAQAQPAPSPTTDHRRPHNRDTEDDDPSLDVSVREEHLGERMLFVSCMFDGEVDSVFL